MANEAKQFTIGGVTHDVMDVGARQLIVQLQAAIDAITSGDTTTAIKTFQEVIDFLDGVTDDATLIGKLNELRTLISAKYTKPASGIPASDLANGVIPDVSGFATKTEVNAKANSADVYSKSETNTAIQEAVEGIEAGETVVINSDGANIVDEHDNNSVLLAPSARQMKLMYNNFMALYNSLANIAFTDGKPTLDWVGTKTQYTLSYGTLTGCTADVAAGQVNEGALRIKLTPTQSSYAFTSVTVNGQSVQTTATGDADGSVYLDIVVNGNITVAATAISGRAVNFNGTGCSIGAAGVAIGQDLDTTITANEHFTLPASITVKIGNTNVTHTYTRAQDNKTATLHIDAANITGDLTITCTAVEDAHVTLAISGSNFVVKQGNTELSNGSKVYNGSAAQTLTIEPASGYKFSTLPSADKGTMTNNGPYAASSLEIGTSVSGTLTITATATALNQSCQITLPATGSGIAGVVLTDLNGSAISSPVIEGTGIKVVLTPDTGSTITVGTITMNGAALVENTDYTLTNNDGVVTIAIQHVTGAVVVNATAVQSHNVTLNCTNCTSSNNDTTTEGTYYAEFTYQNNDNFTGNFYNFAPKVMMGNTEITWDVYTFDDDNGKGIVNIPNVTGDIVIDMVAVVIVENSGYNVANYSVSVASYSGVTRIESYLPVNPATDDLYLCYMQKPSTGNGMFPFYNASKTCIGWAQINAENVRSYHCAGGQVHYAQMSVKDIDNCYLYDTDNKRYIWRGKNNPTKS